MKQLIDKSALVAEIENIEADAICQYNSDKSRYAEGCLDVTHRIKHLLDAFEAKEVDLEKAINGLTSGWIEGEEYGELQNINTACCVTLEEVKEAMRCIYELGLMHRKEE